MEMPEEFLKLPPKRRDFVREYLIDKNGTQAAIRAKYAPNSAQEQASRMLSCDMVQAAIAAIEAKTDQVVLDKLTITKEKVLTRLMQGKTFDVRRLYKQIETNKFDDDGNQIFKTVLKQPYELDDDTAMAVVGVRFDKDTGVLVEYKTMDVKGCAELIGKHLKLWNEVGSKENPVNLKVSRVELVALDNGPN